MLNLKITIAPRFIIAVLTTLITLYAAGCQTQNALSNSRNSVSNSQISDSHVTDPDLEQNRQLWAEKKITSCKMVVDDLLPGMRIIARPVLIEVKDGKPISISPISKDDKGSIKEYENIGTVDRMFEIIQRALDKGAIVEVKYNKDYGYPEEMYLNYGTAKAKGGIDSYSTTKISKFEIVQ